MNKKIILGIFILAVIFVGGVASVDAFSRHYKAQQIDDPMVQINFGRLTFVYKFIDGDNTCYVSQEKMGTSISCVKTGDFVPIP